MAKFLRRGDRVMISRDYFLAVGERAVFTEEREYQVFSTEVRKGKDIAVMFDDKRKERRIDARYVVNVSLNAISN